MNSNKNSYSKQEKEKKPKKESLFGENSLKIGRIILIVIGSCYLLSFLGRTPYVIFNSDSIGLMMLFFFPLVVSIVSYLFFYRWVLSKRQERKIKKDLKKLNKRIEKISKLEN